MHVQVQISKRLELAKQEEVLCRCEGALQEEECVAQASANQAALMTNPTTWHTSIAPGLQ